MSQRLRCELIPAGAPGLRMGCANTISRSSDAGCIVDLVQNQRSLANIPRYATDSATADVRAYLDKRRNLARCRLRSAVSAFIQKGCKNRASRNLGRFRMRAVAERYEPAVEYFKHAR
jgi:hypothetical protein